MEWIKGINLTASYMIILGTVLGFVSYSGLFYFKHARQFENEYQSLSNGEFNWLIWPAVGANFFCERLFGLVGTAFVRSFTLRSASVTLLISLLANSICIILILLSIPEDAPSFEAPLVEVLVLSYLVFITFNFFGDLLSVNITRHILSKIVQGRCNFIKYIAIDALGILLSYFVTLLPSLVIFFYCWHTPEEFNKLVQVGLFGNALIPFFLFIFATSNLPLPFIIFSAIAVFSVTIPTVLFLFLMGFCYFGYRIYRAIWKDRSVTPIEGVLRSLLMIGKSLLLLGTALLALMALL